MRNLQTKTAIAVAVLAIVVLGLGLLSRPFFFLARPVHLDAAPMDVYRVDGDRLLVVGVVDLGQLFLINKQERVVVRPSWLGHRYGPLLVWPRSSLQGVVLGDGVKGDEAESFSFDPAGVTIRYVVRDQLQSVYVPFEYQSSTIPSSFELSRLQRIQNTTADCGREEVYQTFRGARELLR